jgi:hypothetical protein
MHQFAGSVWAVVLGAGFCFYVAIQGIRKQEVLFYYSSIKRSDNNVLYWYFIVFNLLVGTALVACSLLRI